MASKYSYHPLSGTNSIRVLLLQPHAKRQAILRCTLVEINLDVLRELDTSHKALLYVWETTTGTQTLLDPSYTAVSYVWGATTGTRTLLCDGAEILITPNCESALRHLRHRREIIHLWIDAICIDQNNMKERENQVSIMGDVYLHASRVIIWLGEGNNAISKCFSRIQLVSPHLHRMRNVLLVSQKLEKKMLAKKMFSLLTANIPAQDFVEILQNDWVNRVWTIQEYAFASNPTVKYGDYETSFGQFSQFQFFASGFASICQYFGENLGLIVENLNKWQNRQHMRMPKDRLSQIDPKNTYRTPRGKAGLLASAMYISQANNCSNPLDKVYGIYGIFTYSCTFRLDELPPVNYMKEKIELYTEFTEATIRATKKFWPTSMFYWRSEPTSTLPSWVPDPEKGSFQTSEFHNPLHEYMYPSNLTTNASRDSIVVIQPQQHQTFGHLAIKGISITALDICGERWPNSSADEHTVIRCVLSWIMLCAQVDRDVISKDCYRKDANILQDLGWVLDGIPSTGGKSKARTEFINFFGRIMIWQQEYLRADHTQIDSLIDFVRAELTTFMKDQKLFRNSRINFVIFVTSSGHVGITMGHIQKGDTIALLAGGDRPVVLRRLESGHWRYIGSTYIHRIMNGEAWPVDKSTEELETFVLV